MRFVRQSRAIKVTNLDGKVQTDKETLKHGNMLPASILSHLYCAVICRLFCGRTNVLISLLKSVHSVRFENVYMYSKSLQQPKFRYLANLLGSIGCTNRGNRFSNNSDVIPLSASEFHFYLWWRGMCKQVAIREYFVIGTTTADVDCFYLSVGRTQRYQSTLYATMQICCSCSNRMIPIWNAITWIPICLMRISAIYVVNWQQKYGFLVTRLVRLPMGDTKKDLMTL